MSLLLTSALVCTAGIIAGTSSCFMAVSRQPCPVPGVWGPYWSAMLPGLWLSEGGQSASGRLLEHVITSHPAGRAPADTNRWASRLTRYGLFRSARGMGMCCATSGLYSINVFFSYVFSGFQISPLLCDTTWEMK